MRSRILWSAGVLLFLWLALPVRLPTLSSDPAEKACATLGDTAPDFTRPGLVAVLERCSARRPGDVELMADLGLVYEQSNRPADAMALYRRALSLDPGDGDLRLRLGRLLLRRGDLAAARREAEQALAVQPNRRAVLDLLHATQVH